MTHAILDYVNIPAWHSAGYTGNGVKVLVYEVTTGTELGDPSIINYADYNGHIIDPLGTCFGSVERTHMEDVVDVALYVAPNISEVHVYKGNLTGALQYCIEHDIDIMNYSATGGADNDEFNALEEQAIANGTFFVCSAGNDGSGGLTGFSRKDTWLSVGALRMHPDGVVSRTYYSSYDGWGDDLDVMSFGDIYFPNTHHEGEFKGVTGTSFSSPFMVGAIACYKDYYMQKHGRKPTWTEVYNFVVDNCVDMESAGYDVYTGHGAFIMPEVEDLKRVVKMTIGSTIAYLNGVPVTIEIAPYVENGRTRLAVRDMSNILGAVLTLSGNDITLTID